MKTRKPLCPVCGFGLDQPPTDFNICPSCGTEFGYSDSGRSNEFLREQWLSHGAKWASKVDKKPKGWDPFVQLENLGFIYSPNPATINRPVVQWTAVPYQITT